MMYSNKVISFGKLKNAAIYFDSIIPANIYLEFILAAPLKENATLNEQFDMMSELFDSRVITELLPENLVSDECFMECLKSLQGKFFEFFMSEIIWQFTNKARTWGVTNEKREQLHNAVANLTKNLACNYNLHDYLYDMPIDLIDQEQSPSSTLVTENPLLTISNTNIIDSTNVSWDHILEFRKSPNAISALRRLRLFAFENYAGKSLSFVEDDLGQRLSDYQKTAKEWGFKTRKGIISSILTSKIMGGALTGSLISTLTDQSVTALSLVVGGITVELAGVLLEVRSRKFEFEKITRENPITYIDIAQNRFKDEIAKHI